VFQISPQANGLHTTEKEEEDDDDDDWSQSVPAMVPAEYYERHRTITKY